MDTFTAVYVDPHMVFTFSGGTIVSYTASLLLLAASTTDPNLIVATGNTDIGITVLDWTQMTLPAGAISRSDAITKINALILQDENFDDINVTTLTASGDVKTTSTTASTSTTTGSIVTAGGLGSSGCY